MFKYYNPHPKGLLTDDCVKRAIAVCTGTDIVIVSKQLNAFKKLTGAKRFNTDHNPHLFAEDALGAEKITCKNKITAKDFGKKYPRGRYILDMDGHWSSCVNGDIYDTWDCSGENVNFAYKIDTEGYRPPDLKKQFFRYCCTSERISESETRIRIYDGNSAFVERKIPAELTAGYVRCLEDSKYNYIEL